MLYIINESAVSSLAQDIKQTSNYVEFVTTLQEADVKNRNGRIYPKQVIEQGLQGIMIQENLRKHCLFGECGHPTSTDINRQANVDMKNAAFRINSFWWEGNLLKAKCQTLDTSLGRDMAGMIKEGCELSFSMRGQGNVVNDPTRGCQVVQSPLMLITYDWVYLPSHEKAYMDRFCEETKASMFNIVDKSNYQVALNESINLYENGKLTEITESKKEKGLKDYTKFANKKYKSLSECYHYDDTDKIVKSDELYTTLENNESTKKVFTEDYLLKSIRHEIRESVCGIAPTDNFECNVTKPLADIDAKKQAEISKEKVFDEKESKTVEPIENTDAVKPTIPVAESCKNEAMTEPANPAVKIAKEMGVSDDGVSGETGAENITSEEEKEDEKDLAEAFTEYLQEDPLDLNEEILDEGKILNAIRWKLAKFSLRFLSNKSLDEFLMAYFADKDGKPTKESNEWKAKSRKEKVKKLRQLADNLKQEDRDKIANNPAAKQLEKSGLVSAATGAISIGGALVAGASSSKLSHINKNDTDLDLQLTTQGHLYNTGAGHLNGPGDGRSVDITSTGVDITSTGSTSRGGYGYVTTQDAEIFAGDTDKYPGSQKVATLTSQASASATIGSDVLFAIAKVASLLHATMWGALIVGAAGAAVGICKFHKATVLRRDEILSELKSKKNLKEEFSKMYSIIKEESGLTEEKDILKKALKYKNFMTEDCAFVFETLLKSED